MQIKVEIPNLDALRRAFILAPNIIGRNIQMALRASALAIARESKTLTPVDTGRLRSSTYTHFSSGLTAEIGTDTNYDYFVHEGTRFMSARPYLRFAVETQQGFVQAEIAAAVENSMKFIARSA